MGLVHLTGMGVLESQSGINPNLQMVTVWGSLLELGQPVEG